MAFAAFNKAPSCMTGGIFPPVGCEKRTVCIHTETQCADARGVIEREHIVDVAIRLLVEDVFADGALDQHSAPAVRTAVMNCAEECRAMLSAALQRERGGIDGESVGAIRAIRRAYSNETAALRSAA